MDNTFSLQSPFRSPAKALLHPAEDQLSYFPVSASQPLLTPRKNATLLSAASHSLVRPGTLGTKRKCTSINSNTSTPLRQRVLTPISNVGEREDGSPSSFDRLAPLPAPRFTSLAPQSDAEAEESVNEQEETMVHLRLADNHSRPYGVNVGDDSDSGCEVAEDDGDRLFLSGPPVVTRSKPGSLTRKVGRQLLEANRATWEANRASTSSAAGPSRALNISTKPRSPKEAAEVAEAVSPGGHINKRRARSRPVSIELVETAKAELARSFRDVPPHHMAESSSQNLESETAIAFPLRSPAESRFRPRTMSNSTSTPSEAGSPLPRRRINSTAKSPQRRVSGPSRGAIPGSARGPVTRSARTSLTRPVPAVTRHSGGPPQAPHAQTLGRKVGRAPLARIDSATMFFGPENTFGADFATPQRPTARAAMITTPTSSTMMTPQRKRTNTHDSMDDGFAFASPLAVRPQLPSRPSLEFKRPHLGFGKPVFGAVRPSITSRPSITTRHSYAGDGTPMGNASLSALPLNMLAQRGLSADMLAARSKTPSPKSSPMTVAHGSPYEEDEDMFFGSGGFGTPNDGPVGTSPFAAMDFDSPADSPFTTVPRSSSSARSKLGPDRSFQLNNPSFVFSITSGTPSPRLKSNHGASGSRSNSPPLDWLPSKYKPRDSGVVMSSDDDHTGSHSTAVRPTLTPAHFNPFPRSSTSSNAMPTASTSVSTMDSDDYTGLVTPGFAPAPTIGWPVNVHTGSSTDDLRYLHSEDASAMDDFIMHVLDTGAAACTSPIAKKVVVPGTPVKKAAKAAWQQEGGGRPWQSAVAPKVGFDFDAAEAAAAQKGGKKKAPRKSLPAAFPALRTKKSKPLIVAMEEDAEDDDEYDDSPSSRKRYDGLGLGRPNKPLAVIPPVPPLPTKKEKEAPPPLLSLKERTRWLYRRSSSGQFSIGGGSDSGSGSTTPTRLKGKDWHLPTLVSQQPSPLDATKISPMRTASRFSNGGGRSTSSSSTTSTIQSPLNSPTTRQRLPALPPVRPMHARRESHDPNMLAPHSRCGSQESPLASTPSPQSSPELSRFERDFIEVKEEGSGEFGKVIQVKYKDGRSEVTAVKKSKTFEGIRHRHRLQEEVTILQHLSNATSEGLAGAPGRHPNVLAFLSSWEQDEMLFIQTELCERGNFATFLYTFGRAYPCLDEGRVWKVMVDITNGLRFIHDAGVIHLDLKPSNIFITIDGRFKIGDFGMASLWPKPADSNVTASEREGDRGYLAPEVLQGQYSKAADIFSFGITMLEAAANVVIPDQGPAWQRLRSEDYRQVKLAHSPELFEFIKGMMRRDPAMRLTIQTICAHPILCRARASMERVYEGALQRNTSVYAASPLAPPTPGFLEEILGRTISHIDDMDLSP